LIQLLQISFFRKKLKNAPQWWRRCFSSFVVLVFCLFHILFTNYGKSMMKKGWLLRLTAFVDADLLFYRSLA